MLNANVNTDKLSHVDVKNRDQPQCWPPLEQITNAEECWKIMLDPVVI